MLFPARILKPAALAMLTGVCRTICDEKDVSLAGPEGQKTASRLLKLYMNGLTDRNELLEAERNRGLLEKAAVSTSLYQSEMTHVRKAG